MLSRLLLAFLLPALLPAALSAQSLVVQNLAPHPQQRWTSIMVPKDRAPKLASGIVTPWGWPFARSDGDFGDQVRIWVLSLIHI